MPEETKGEELQRNQAAAQAALAETAALNDLPPPNTSLDGGTAYTVLDADKDIGLSAPAPVSVTHTNAAADMAPATLNPNKVEPPAETPSPNRLDQIALNPPKKPSRDEAMAEQLAEIERIADELPRVTSSGAVDLAAQLRAAANKLKSAV